MTYIDNRSISCSSPVNRVENDGLCLEQVLDVRHELYEVPLSPPLLMSLTIVLNEIPRVVVVAPYTSRMAQSECSLLLISRDLRPANGKLAQSFG